MKKEMQRNKKKNKNVENEEKKWNGFKLLETSQNWEWGQHKNMLMQWVQLRKYLKEKSIEITYKSTSQIPLKSTYI